MAKLAAQCMSIGGWENFRKEKHFKVNKREALLLRIRNCIFFGSKFRFLYILSRAPLF